jgi:UDPglucose--hexose-1-phosphate uridylyltransferase
MNEETLEVLKVYKDRYNSISQDECGDYVLIFHNHGRLAGASVYHNHSQILSMPIIPPGILKNIKGAKDFFERTGEKVHEMIIEWEIEQNKRIIFENNKFIALCPFVSRTPYEMRIFPKKKSSNFGDIKDEDLVLLAEILNNVLKKLYIALNNPDYTFFVHTSPIKKDTSGLYDFYHWHIEIMPRFSIAAGMELGTNVFVNTVDPDEAAKLLRETNL